MTEPEPTTIISSQSAFPGRAVVRTFIQTWLPGLLAALVVIPEILDAILAGPLPDVIRAWLVVAATAVAAVAGVVARIMAIPRIDAFLQQLGLSSTPRISPPQEPLGPSTP